MNLIKTNNMKEWISVKDRLPEISDEKPFVEVEVRTVHNGIGKCSFGYSGAMGEPREGSFWRPIRDFVGDVYITNEISDWRYLDEEK